MNKRYIWSSVAILTIGVILFILNILVGSVEIGWNDFIGALRGNDSTYRTIILDYRLPQAITAALAGGGLAVAGLLMQTIFRNPLADPSILGISSGASLGVASIVLIAGSSLLSSLWFSTLGTTLAAFVGALAVLLLILTLSFRLKNMVSLILVGIMIAYITGSVTDMMKFFAPKESVHSFVIWGMGTFSSLGLKQIPILAICVVIGSIAAFLLSKTLNLILLGDSYAENLGVNTRKAAIVTILVSGFLTAVVTAFCGPIAFIGLAVPHIARFIFKTSDHKTLTPSTLFIGADLALLCNLIARLPLFDSNLPINSVTALLGAPIVIWVIFYRQKATQR